MARCTQCGREIFGNQMGETRCADCSGKSPFGFMSEARFCKNCGVKLNKSGPLPEFGDRCDRCRKASPFSL